MPNFELFTAVAEAPALDAFTITPGASALAVVPRALVATVGGTATVTTWRGNSVTIPLVEGVIFPLVVTHVTAATATGIVGLV